jgi:hypothetical protein
MYIPIIYAIPKTRKGLIILLSILLAVCVGIAVFITVQWAGDQQSLRENGQPDFNALAEDQLEPGLFVHGSIDIALDVYAEQYESDFGRRTSDDSTSLYYLVPVYNTSDGSISYLITYQAEPEDYATMDNIVAQSWSNDPLTARLDIENGEIFSLPDDLKGYFSDYANDPTLYENGSFIDWCKEYDIFGTDDAAAIEAKLVPYMIKKTSMAGTDPAVIYVFAAIAVLLAASLLFVIFYKKGKACPETTPPEDFNRVKEQLEE